MLEQPELRRGRKWVVASLVCAALSLAITPFMFGLLGVIAGSVAVWKGDRHGGAWGLGERCSWVRGVLVGWGVKRLRK